MCGIVGYVGAVNQQLIDSLVHESEVRGLHHTGYARRGSAGIYHTRYCTSGEDHQPLKLGPNYMVFNGVIDMGTKREMEIKYKINMDTDNDGEIILRLCKTPEQVVTFLKKSNASFAGLWLTKNKLYAIRNEKRPLWMLTWGGAVILASTKDIFNRAGSFDRNLKQLEPLKIYQWQI